MNETKIEWTHFPGYDKGMSWNPLKARLLSGGPAGKSGWACVHVAEGCRFCYAESLNRRLGTGLDYTAQTKGKYELFLDEKTLLAPLKTKGKVCFFTNSMTDLFGLDFGVTEEMLTRIYAVMALTPQHLYLNLTKRSKARREWLTHTAKVDTGRAAERLLEQLADPKMEKFWLLNEADWPLPNVFEGSSIACEKDLHQLDDLMQTPAHKRFVSYEPALEAVDLRPYLYDGRVVHKPGGMSLVGNSGKLSWTIIGGESGPQARPFDIAWARQTIAQCREAGVSCFVKQLGAKPFSCGTIPPSHKYTVSSTLVLRDKKGGDPSEWDESIRVRQFPEVTR